jgi:glutamate-1-semialdehyde 2,1-aminomutase
MEREIDVTQIGHRSNFGEEGLSPDFRSQDLPFDPERLLDRQRVMKLTVKMNTLYTRVLFTEGSPTWNKEASAFLKTIHEDLPLYQASRKDHHLVSEFFDYNTNIATGLESVVSGLQRRLELQLNILYSFVSQTDNRINERIAKNSGRDSTSMKILALISAFFLPGTFVATLFSMSMFQWQPNGNGNGTEGAGGGGNNGGDGGGNAVLSNNFWIYWAVAIPLTALTLIGWALWWQLELKKYDKLIEDKVCSSSPVIY